MLIVTNSILLVVDIQERLFPHLCQKEDFLKNAVAMIKGAQILEVPILITEHAADKIGKTIPEIKNLIPNVSPIAKVSFSCCGEPSFIAALGTYERRQILLAGIESHICVYQTARDLVNMGYDVYAVADAVSARTLQNKEIGLECIKGMGGSITSVETALFELLQIAKGEKFKEILELVK